MPWDASTNWFHPLCPRHSIKTSGAVPTQDSGGLAHPQPLAGCGNRDTKLSVGGARPSLEDVLCARRCGPRPGARCVPGVVVAEGAPGGQGQGAGRAQGQCPSTAASAPCCGRSRCEVGESLCSSWHTGRRYGVRQSPWIGYREGREDPLPCQQTGIHFRTCSV